MTIRGQAKKRVDTVDIDEHDDVSSLKGKRVVLLLYDAESGDNVRASGNALGQLEMVEVRMSRRMYYSGDFTYVAEAEPGTVTSAASWRIYRSDRTGGKPVSLLWAEGDTNYDKVANNYASYSYS